MPFDGTESSATSWKVDGVEMLTNCSTVFSFNAILVGGPRRSATTQVPYKDGEEPSAQFWAPQARSLRLELDGLIEPDGTPYGDPIAGLITNTRWARTNLLDRVSTGDGTRLWEIEWRDGITEEGRVLVVNASEDENVDGIYSVIGFDVILPDGPLAPP